MAAEEIRKLDLILDAQGVALGGIEKGEPAQIQKAGPALPVAADNVRDDELLVRIGPKVVLKNAQSVPGFDADGLAKRGRRERANRRLRAAAGASPGTSFQVAQGIVENVLDRLEQIVGLNIGIDLDFHVTDFFLGNLVVAKNEPGRSERDVALPVGDQLLALYCFTDFVSSGYQAVLFRIAEGQVKIGAEGEFVDSGLSEERGGVPAEALAEIIAIANLANHAFPAVLESERFNLRRRRGSSEYRGHVIAVRLKPVLAFCRLEKLQIVALAVFDGAYAQIGVEREEKNVFAGVTRLNGDLRGRIHFRIVRHGGVDLIAGDQEILACGGIVINMARIAAVRRKIHPDVPDFHRAAITPAADANFFKLHGVVPNFNPAFVFGLQVGEEIGGAFSVAGHDTLEEPREVFGADIFALFLAFGIEIVSSAAGRSPLHLFLNLFEESVRKAESGIAKCHVEPVLLCKEPQLMRLRVIGRIGLHTPIAMKNRGKHGSIHRLGELNRAVKQGNMHAVADDLDVLGVRGLCGVHRRAGECIPYIGCRGRCRSLRMAISGEKRCKNDRKKCAMNHESVSWYASRKYLVFALQASAERWTCSEKGAMRIFLR
jgi:hypothetical protein